MDDPKKPVDKRQPALVDDEEERTVRRDAFAGPEGQDETDNPIEYDGGEVSGINRGEGGGRKPANGAG